MTKLWFTSVASLLTLAGLMGFSASAKAHEPGWVHERVHEDFNHREFHRRLEHRDAHRYPMTWREHERLHDIQNHERFHDRLEHREIHRQVIPYRSFSISPFGVYYNSVIPGYYSSYGFGR